MRKILTTLVVGSLVCTAGTQTAVADSHEGGMTAVPVEMFACTYNDGKSAKDLDKAIGSWNKWADGAGLSDYTAWTLAPYYASANQDFDVLWLGVAPSAKSLGASQDKWVTTGSRVQAEFDDAITCQAHTNMATLTFKSPPDIDNPPDNVVMSFSDCNMADDVNFGEDVMPALTEWAKYRGDHGSDSGIWVMFPAYGGGGEEFDFKYVTGSRSLEAQGEDWDQYSKEGRIKAAELFRGKVDCDSSRVYLAKNRRRGTPPE